MKDIFANLIINALEAMPQGGEITLETGVEKDTTGVLSIFISVKDTGPGIPEETKDRLFEPFFTTKEYGQGLGLFLTRYVLFQYDGKIEVESKPGQGGACFTIRLPVAEAHKGSPTPPLA